MKFFTKRTDGGPYSNVVGYWLVEIKGLFSIALLRFSQGSRENFHSHAFNAVSWILSGYLIEELLSGDVRHLTPSIFPVHTPKDNTHKVFGVAESTWALTFRGPWGRVWQEVTPKGDIIKLTNGRKVLK